MSSFSGLNIASSGLFASQKALEIVSKNIANANTVGYSRQQAILSPASHDLGVDVSVIQQIRESYLDSQYRSELCHLGEWETKTDALGMMEEFLKEPSEQGLNHAIGIFSNSMQDVSKNPESLEMRAQLLQSSLALTDTFHYIYNKLVELQDNQNNQIESAVAEINKFADEIITLNDEIRRYEGTREQKENDLRDLRNNVLDKLSRYTDISVRENSNGTISVMIGSEYLVDGDTVNHIEVVSDTDNKIPGEPKLYSIRFENSGSEVEITGGKIRGYLDIRDGGGIAQEDSPKFFGIPYFINELSLLAKTMIKEVNDIHSAGYTFPNGSNGNTSETGISFFVPADAENTASAKNISLSEEILENVYNIAASHEPINDVNRGNNTIIKRLAELCQRKDIKITIDGVEHDIGSFESYMKRIASGLAVVSSDSIKRHESQTIITQNIENKRLSVSGVSIDEEMTSMIKFQNAYNASARIISAINQMLEALINLGR